MRSFKGYTGVNRKSDAQKELERKNREWLSKSEFERHCISRINYYTKEIESLEAYKQREERKDKLTIIETSLNLNIQEDLIQVINKTIQRIDKELSDHYGKLDYWKELLRKYKEVN